MTSGKRSTISENSMRFLDKGVIATAELIERALRKHGKKSLYEKDDNGIISLDKLITPLRRQYEKWIESYQMLDDYERDPNVSEDHKNLVLLWWMDHDSITPSQAQQAEETYSIWGYGKYCLWVINALYRYAKEQGLSEEDVAAVRTPLEKWVADVVREALAQRKKSKQESIEQ